MGGVSPGFRIPPPSVVQGAEVLKPEPGNPSVMVRHIRAAVLYELSIVTRPAYADTEVELRAMFGAQAEPSEDPAPSPIAKPRYWL